MARVESPTFDASAEQDPLAPVERKETRKMMDRYTKVVLTVIALALMWLCLLGPGSKWGPPVGVSIVQVGTRPGRPLSGFDSIPVCGRATQISPVEVKAQ